MSEIEDTSKSKNMKDISMFTIEGLSHELVKKPVDVPTTTDTTPTSIQEPTICVNDPSDLYIPHDVELTSDEKDHITANLNAYNK